MKLNFFRPKKICGSLLHLISVLLTYPRSIVEMHRCKRSPRYKNTFSAHQAALYIYLLSRGYSESIDDLVFGPRLWRSHQPPDGEGDQPEQRVQVSKYGYARCGIHMAVKDLLSDLDQVVFVGRIAGDRQTLIELQNRHPNLRGRYDADQDSLLSLKSFAKIVTSQEVYQYAYSILGPKFLFTSALVWASLPCDTKNQQITSAQAFHMDYDYLDDIKLFINLVEVDEFSGPLEYVACSHRPGQKKIWSAEPIAEEKVWSLHPLKNRVLFTGSKGSIYISDNRGLHRDAPPHQGCWKLAMQVNFSRNQFGAEEVYSSQRPTLSPEWPAYEIWKNVLRERPSVYDLLFSPPSSAP